MLGKIFCKRKILIVTDERITSVPLSVSTQIAVLLTFSIVVSWLSFSSGKYFSYKEIVRQKEVEVHQANLMNLDLQNRIDSLQGNLVRLNNYFSTVKNFDHNQNGAQGGAKGKSDKTSSLDLKNLIEKNKVVGSIQKRRYASQEKEDIVKEINENTVNRIDELEKIIAMTGLALSNVASPSETKLDLFVEYYNPNLSKGGPETHNMKVDLVKQAPVFDIDDGIGFAENVSKLLYLENLVNSLPTALPMKRYYISSLYGVRDDPILKSHQTAFHYGMDFAGPRSEAIYATAPGVIKFAGKKGNYGEYIEIDHGYNITTRYGHLSNIIIRKGEKVKRGQLIGYQGTTGRSTGEHLHYELRYKNNPYDPLKFITAGKYVL